MVLVAAVVIARSTAAQTQIHVYTVPNATGDDWNAIQETLALVGSGPAVVRFLAGQYDIFVDPPAMGEKRQPLRLDDTSNVTIRGAVNGGTTLVLHGFDPNAPAWESNQQPPHAYPRQIFSFMNVQTLKFERLTVKMAREPYSIGNVLSQIRTGDIRSVVLEMEQDYPDIANGFRIQRINDFKWSAPRRLKAHRFRVALNDGEYTTTVFRPGGGQKPQVTVSNTPASVGSWFHDSLSHDLIGPPGSPHDSGLVLMHSKYNTHFLKVEHCSGVTVRDVTLQDMPGMGVIAWDTQGITIDNLDLQPQSGRLLSISADGIHLQDCTGAVLVKNCDMRWQGDDGFNVHSRLLQVANPLPAGGSTLVLNEVHGRYEADWAPGGSVEGLEFFAPDLARRSGAIALLTSFARVAPTSTQFNATFSGGYPAGVAPFDFVANTNKQPDSVIVQDCVIEDNYSRGIALHGTNIAVANCTFRRNTGPAVMLETELLSYSEAPPGDGLFVSNCTIDDSNRYNWAFLGAITVAGLNGPQPANCLDQNNGVAAAGLHRNVSIEDNLFTNLGCDVVNRRAAIWVTSTDILHFSGNQFTNIGYGTIGCEQNILRLENSTQATSPGDNVVWGFPIANWFTFVGSTLNGPTPAGQNW